MGGREGGRGEGGKGGRGGMENERGIWSVKKVEKI